jgi:hypothetical protein
MQRTQLDLGFLDDALLNCSFGDETEHANNLFLPDAVSAIHRLKVHLRVPVRVEPA